MINALDKKINALAARHSWHISPRAGDGLHWYEVAPMDRPDRDAILRTLARCKGLTAETWEPYSPTAWACVIRVYDAAELAEWRRVDAQKTDLANYFCQIIHDGGTQEQAKARPVSPRSRTRRDAGIHQVIRMTRKADGPRRRWCKPSAPRNGAALMGPPDPPPTPTQQEATHYDPR